MASRTSAAEMVSYDDLYSRWEQGNWKAGEFDFGQDREDWHEKFSNLERRAALWNYSMFFHGEDSVATNLTPYIDAAPREEQKYFLTTQQVDEARHAVFFARFMSEVVDTGDSIAASLATTQPELSWGFKKVFSRLDRMADELRRDRSQPKLAGAITLYHLIVEASASSSSPTSRTRTPRSPRPWPRSCARSFPGRPPCSCRRTGTSGTSPASDRPWSRSSRS